MESGRGFSWLGAISLAGLRFILRRVCKLEQTVEEHIKSMADNPQETTFCTTWESSRTARSRFRGCGCGESNSDFSLGKAARYLYATPAGKFMRWCPSAGSGVGVD